MSIARARERFGKPGAFVLASAQAVVAAFFLLLPVPAGAEEPPTTEAIQVPTVAEGGSSREREPAGNTGRFETGFLQSLRFTGLVQVWYQAASADMDASFRVRRSELSLKGEVIPGARFVVMLDPSKALAVNQETSVGADGAPTVETKVNQASRILQDAYISVALTPHVGVQIGQFKIPLGFEGLASSSALPLVERALMTTDRARGGAYGDIRDIGVMALGTFDNGLGYHVGIFNALGPSQNTIDQDGHKAFAGRLTYATPFTGLSLGVFGATDHDTSTDTRRRRAGADAQFVRGRLVLQGELATGSDGELDRRGYYLTVGYRLTPVIEVVGRLDSWDPDITGDTDPSNVLERDFICGITYYQSGNHTKWQLEYLRKTYKHDIAPARHVLLANAQLSW